MTTLRSAVGRYAMDIAGVWIFRVVGAGIGEDRAAIRREGEILGTVELDALDLCDQDLGPAARPHRLN